MTGTALDSLAQHLDLLVAAECGGDFRAAHLAVMEDGHAGLTFGFDVCSAAGVLRGSYVLKLAPAGVVRRGNTDVFRQASLLRALKSAGLPVPGVPWAAPDEAALGSPFIVMEKLPGRVFVGWEPHASFGRDPQRIRPLWLEAATLLAQFHRLDWQRLLPDWEAPRPLAEELARWAPVLRHAQDPDWLAAGTALGARLTATMPDEHPVGLAHGDFQPGNILYTEGKAVGVIDWELSSIGAQGLDLGWLLMMADGTGWDPVWRPLAPVTRKQLVDTYRTAGGPALAHTDWYQALAHYRMGAIACLNVKLHRSGKRVDALWERFAPSVSRLFARGAELAEHAAPTRTLRSHP